MKRKIKFRVWNNIKDSQTFGMSPSAENHENWGDYLFYDKYYTLMQYTGLLDENGKEIFEGDIVVQGLNNRKFIVKFGNVKRNVVSHFDESIPGVEIPCFYFECVESKLPFFAIVENSYNQHDLETIKVIGNIFENPDLLK